MLLRIGVDDPAVAHGHRTAFDEAQPGGTGREGRKLRVAPDMNAARMFADVHAHVVRAFDSSDNV